MMLSCPFQQLWPLFCRPVELIKIFFHQVKIQVACVIIFTKCPLQYQPPAHIPLARLVKYEGKRCKSLVGSPLNVPSGTVIIQPLTDIKMPKPCCKVHGKPTYYLFISGVGTIYVQPPHHRQIAFPGEVAHGFDCTARPIGPDALDIRNIVGIESNILVMGSIHSSLILLINPSVPHLLSSGLVILDRSAGVEELPPLELGFLTAAFSASIGRTSCTGGGRHCMEQYGPRYQRQFSAVGSRVGVPV